MARPLPLRRTVTQERARELRSDTTPAEQLVWAMLRDRRLAGLKFRRQYPIGPYIADFYCHEAKLIVELDGESHEYSIKHDAERTRYMDSLKLQFFRVTNDDVTTNLEGVGWGIMRTAGIDVEAWLAERERASRQRSAPSP